MADRIKITLAAGSGVTFGVDDISCATATTHGFWEREGLDVTWIPRHGGVQALAAVLDGSADVSYGGLGPVLHARASGKPVRIVVSMARGLAQNLVVQKRIATPAALASVSWALDGFGALSHHLARLVLKSLGIDEKTIRWEAVGPPPERIERLLADTIDASQIRVEEAISLSRAHPERLRTLLGFSDLKRLVPVQPHGVLATTEAFEKANPEALRRLARGMMRASRALHDERAVFETAIARHVTIALTPEVVRSIWQQEHDTGGFAVNGELTRKHWAEQMRLYFELNPELRRVTRAEVIADGFVADALARIGTHPAPFDQPGT
ncbi:MAG: ABC transporter substrate-binding protein [Alphaproteobacteria bacterium]|nr:ABC transporter substrate-binding protein [Alphaproteobacteria bacterium]